MLATEGQGTLFQGGTRFRAQLEEVRRDLAHDFLRSGTYSVTEISYLLGFSDSANFSRPFRRWTGRLPSQTLPT
jgi:AraC-like DNA-binding protein